MKGGVQQEWQVGPHMVWGLLVACCKMQALVTHLKCRISYVWFLDWSVWVFSFFRSIRCSSFWYKFISTSNRIATYKRRSKPLKLIGIKTEVCQLDRRHLLNPEMNNCSSARLTCFMENKGITNFGNVDISDWDLHYSTRFTQGTRTNNTSKQALWK